MKSSTGILAVIGFAVALLVGVVAMGSVDDQPSTKVAASKPRTEQRVIERRRGRIAEVAIADATNQ